MNLDNYHNLHFLHFIKTSHSPLIPVMFLTCTVLINISPVLALAVSMAFMSDFPSL